MRRDVWLFVVIGLSVCAVAAGWFAVNAPEVSRPRFADLGPVSLSTLEPPLPPAALSRPEGGGFESLRRRPLFTPQGGAAGSRQATGAPAALPRGVVPFRAVMAPLATAPQADLRPLVTDRAPLEAFQAGFGIPKPSHKQFFGGHLIPDAVRSTDPEAPPEAPIAPIAEGEGGGPPRPRPRPGSFVGSGEEGGAGAGGAGAAPDPVAAAATRPGDPGAGAAGDADDALGEGPDAGQDVDIIVLGVLIGPGAERALVRTPNGENRRVSRGDEIAGWRVSAISEDFIRLRRASQTRELRVPK